MVSKLHREPLISYTHCHQVDVVEMSGESTETRGDGLAVNSDEASRRHGSSDELLLADSRAKDLEEGEEVGGIVGADSVAS
jgi:hypothetical protein